MAIENQGFVVVDDEHISNIDEFYSKNKEGLKSILELESKLAFIPSRASKHSEYKFLGASAGGVNSACGFSAMNKIFHTPMGKLSILEEDLIAASGFTLVEPEYLNIHIGKHLAIVDSAQRKK